MDESRRGRQTPTKSVVLPYTDTHGQEAVDLYNSTGRTAQEWQELLTYDILAVNEDGLRHQDFDGKNCPAGTMANGWLRFLGMVQADLNNLNEEEEDMKKYNTIEEIPDYGKATVQRLEDAGALQGTGEGLGLSEDMLRILVILDRLGKL